MKKNLNFLKGKIAIQKAENKITVIASDETLDRHGDVLPIDAWDLSKFKKAPRMLVDHDHQVSSIVGKWENVRIEGKQMLMDAVFHDITELARAVKEMVIQGFLDTVSVGFIWHGPERDGDRPSFELIETSWVTVPANPNAHISKSLIEGVTADEKAKVAEFVGKTEDEENLESSDEILPDEEEAIAEPELGSPENAVETIEEAKQFAQTEKVYACVTSGFLKQLIADSEKLKTLTDAADKATVDAEKTAKIIRFAMKEAAHIVNDTLMRLNRK